MRPGANQRKGFLFSVNLVDQQPVRFDVTIAIPHPVSNQHMIALSLGKGLFSVGSAFCCVSLPGLKHLLHAAVAGQPLRMFFRFSNRGQGFGVGNTYRKR